MATSHYGLSQVAGTDLVNFPTVNNADNTIIDDQLYANAQATASAQTTATNASSASASNAQAITNLTTVVTTNKTDTNWVSVTGYTLAVATVGTEVSITASEIIGKREVLIKVRGTEQFRFVNDGSTDKITQSFIFLNGTLTDGYTMQYYVAVNFSTGKIYLRSNIHVNTTTQPLPFLSSIAVRNQ